MSIEIRDARREDELEAVSRYVEQSPHGTPFHRPEALAVLADHAGGEYHVLVGYKGQEPVGVFPVVEIKKAGVSTVFSPPPGLLVTFLGPALLNFEKLKQRKAERRHERFIEGCLAWLDDELNPRYTHVRTPPGYEDLRPYHWNGFSVEPFYTYCVDLDADPDDLIMSFSSDARKNIRDAATDRYEIREGGVDAVGRIFERIRDRYEEQDESYPLTREFVTDLYRGLPDGSVRPYECYVDSEFAGGILALEDDRTLYRWQGGARFDLDLAVNDLLDWHLIEEGMARDRDRYDLVGANTRRLNDYKAKFAPELTTYYSVEGGTPAMRLLASLYKRGLKLR